MPENVDKSIDNLTIIEIKSELRKRGLSMSGCKGVLLDRLRESLQQNSAEPESSRSDVTTMTPGSNQPGPEDNSVSLRCVLLAVNQLQADVRALDLKFTNHISAISEKLSTAFPDKEKLTQLELEKQKLLDTIDMLRRDNNKNTITPPVARVEQLKTCSSTIGCTSVPTKNRFAPLSETPDGDADILDEDSGVAEAEKIIDSYYDALRPSTNGRHTPESERNVSFHEQLRQYREKHRNKYNSDPASKADVLIIGDSMIKHISGPRLSRSKQIKCFAKPGVKVDDIYPHAIGLIKKHKPREVIVHVGTNNIREEPDAIYNIIVSVGETLESVSDINRVTISGIIHRNGETEVEKSKVTSVNHSLNEFAEKHNWGFVDNSNITCRHLCSDGVHLSRQGQGVLAKNFLRHIYQGSTPLEQHRRAPQSPSRLHPRHTENEAPKLYSEAVRKPTAQQDRGFWRPLWKTRKRRSQSQSPERLSPRTRATNNRRPLPSQEHEWLRYQQKMTNLNRNRLP